MRPNPKLHVYLDEIDVLQMCYAAFESYPNETFGLFLGETTIGKKGRRVFKIHFIQVLQRGKRTTDNVFYKDEKIQQLIQNYTFDVIGDFHSHPEDEHSRLPSKTDVVDVMNNYGNNSIFAILKIKSSNRTDAKIKREKTRIACLLNGLIIYIYFYSPKPELNGYRNNKTPE